MPRQRACISPARCGRITVPPTKPEQMSVPPQPGATQQSCFTLSWNHCWHSGETGEPASVMDFRCVRSNFDFGTTPFFSRMDW